MLPWIGKYTLEVFVRMQRIWLQIDWTSIKDLARHFKNGMNPNC